MCIYICMYREGESIQQVLYEISQPPNPKPRAFRVQASYTLNPKHFVSLALLSFISHYNGSLYHNCGFSLLGPRVKLTICPQLRIWDLQNLAQGLCLGIRADHLRMLRFCCRIHKKQNKDLKHVTLQQNAVGHVPESNV